MSNFLAKEKLKLHSKNQNITFLRQNRKSISKNRYFIIINL